MKKAHASPPRVAVLGCLVAFIGCVVLAAFFYKPIGRYTGVIDFAEFGGTLTGDLLIGRASEGNVARVDAAVESIADYLEGRGFERIEPRRAPQAEKDPQAEAIARLFRREAGPDNWTELRVERVVNGALEDPSSRVALNVRYRMRVEALASNWENVEGNAMREIERIGEHIQSLYPRSASHR